MRSHRFPLRAAAGLFAALLMSCIGGTGTDTENGVATNKDGALHGATGLVARVVDAEGRPLPGVLLALHTPDFRPDSGAAPSLVFDPAKPLVSDSLGYVRIDLLNPGRYVAEGRLAGSILFFDTLAIADLKVLTVDTLQARPGIPVTGRVRLESGLTVDSGRVFIRGTAIHAKLDTAGAYDLGALPADVGRMAIGIRYRASVREARIAEQKSVAGTVDTVKFGTGDTVKPVFTCREVSVDSAARLSSRSAFDKGQNVVAGAPSFGSGDTVKLDTARMSAVNRSCDSLYGGTVIAVRSQPLAGVLTGPVKQDTLTINLIAVGGALTPGAAVPADVLTGTQTLVPLYGCVAPPGTDNTTYVLSLVPTASGNDLFVGDVDDKCQR